MTMSLLRLVALVYILTTPSFSFKTCESGLDCVQAEERCENSLCIPLACLNQVLDQEETDVDCGGPSCLPCQDGANCFAPSDCSSSRCSSEGLCQPVTCFDGALSVNETDIDCGGALCNPCQTTQGCTLSTDCFSGLCSTDLGTCLASHCMDNLCNHDESDVDCGMPSW